jgi:hypothetical protein
MMGVRGVNSTMIFCKNFCKCHNVPQYNNNIIKKEKKVSYNGISTSTGKDKVCTLLSSIITF